MLEEKFSQSQENGLSLVKDSDQLILSVGISTAGYAEIKLAQASPGRKVIGTTIDEAGLKQTKELIENSSLSQQIELRLEDIRKPTNYPTEYFDFIYARLILHYLTKDELDFALLELQRILKKGGRLFVVVRSTADWEAQLENNSFDEKSRFTSYPRFDLNAVKTGEIISRYFHSCDSLRTHCEQAGFQALYFKEYDEQLFFDYARTIPTLRPTSLIEALFVK